jgi:hypothetical protein
MKIDGHTYHPDQERRERERFEKLSHFFIWNTGSDQYGDDQMDCSHGENQIIIEGVDTGQTLTLFKDGTWKLSD